VCPPTISRSRVSAPTAGTFLAQVAPASTPGCSPSSGTLLHVFTWPSGLSYTLSYFILLFPPFYSTFSLMPAPLLCPLALNHMPSMIFTWLSHASNGFHMAFHMHQELSHGLSHATMLLSSPIQPVQCLPGLSHALATIRPLTDCLLALNLAPICDFPRPPLTVPPISSSICLTMSKPVNITFISGFKTEVDRLSDASGWKKWKEMLQLWAEDNSELAWSLILGQDMQTTALVAEIAKALSAQDPDKIKAVTMTPPGPRRTARRPSTSSSLSLTPWPRNGALPTMLSLAMLL